jgi:hypothetical protein
VRLEPRDQLSGSGLLGALLQGEAQVLRKQTNDDGEFNFDRLAGGRYRLVVQGPTRGAQRGLFSAPAPLAFELAEGERFVGLELELPAAVRIEGRLVDEAGRPIPGGAVVARPAKESRGRPEAADVAEDGTFVLGGLSPGLWNVSARADGFAPASREALKIEAEGSTEPLVLTLERGLEVTVRVTLAGGAPVEGATATLVALDGTPEVSADPGRFLQGFFRGEATTNALGELRVGTFGSGPHRVTARKGFSESKQTVDLPRGGGVHVVEVDLQ